MPFDPCKHRINQMLLRFGQYLLPGEKDTDKLFEKVATVIGIKPEMMSTKADGNHLPSPKETGPFALCPKCNTINLVIMGICQSCEKARGGKYKTEFSCKNCGYNELSPLFLIQAYQKFGLELPEGFKQRIGIKTVTDDGIK